MSKMLLKFYHVLALTSATAGGGVQSIEIVPFGGYRWSGGLSTTSVVSNFDVRDAAAFGIGLDFNLPKNSAAELYWSHWSGDWEASLVAGGKRSGSFSRDDILVDGIWYSTRPDAAARPYVAAGIGTSIW